MNLTAASLGFRRPKTRLLSSRVKHIILYIPIFKNRSGRFLTLVSLPNQKAQQPFPAFGPNRLTCLSLYSGLGKSKSQLISAAEGWEAKP